MIKALRRVLIRIGFPFAKLYWFLFRPKTFGSKIFIERGNEVLFIRHSYFHKYWGLPGGGRKTGETDEDAVRRETKEELSVTLADVFWLGVVESVSEYKHDTIAVFRASLGAEPIIIDGVEVIEAKWFPKGAPPKLGRVTQKLYNLYSTST